MKKSFLFILLLSSTAVIKSNPNDDSNRPVVVKVIEATRLTLESVQGKEFQAKIMDKQVEFQNDIKKAATELQKEESDLNAKARTLDREILEREARKLEQKKKEYQLKFESEKGSLDSYFQKEGEKYNADVKQTIVETAIAKNWDIAQIKETGEIIYTSSRVNGTNEIIKEHDVKHKNKKAKLAASASSKPAVTASKKPMAQ